MVDAKGELRAKGIRTPNSATLSEDKHMHSDSKIIISRDLAVNYIKLHNMFDKDSLEYEVNLNRAIQSDIHLTICDHLDYLANIMSLKKDNIYITLDKVDYFGNVECDEVSFHNSTQLFDFFKVGRDDSITITVLPIGGIRYTNIKLTRGGNTYYATIYTNVNGVVKPVDLIKEIEEFFEFSKVTLPILMPELDRFIKHIIPKYISKRIGGK